MFCLMFRSWSCLRAQPSGSKTLLRPLNGIVTEPSYTIEKFKILVGRCKDVTVLLAAQEKQISLFITTATYQPELAHFFHLSLPSMHGPIPDFTCKALEAIPDFTCEIPEVGFKPTLSDLQVNAQIQIYGHANYTMHTAFQQLLQGTVLQVSFSIPCN